MSNLELYLIKHLLDADNYDKYHDLLDPYFQGLNNEFKRIWQCLGKESKGVHDLEATLYTNFPGLREKEREAYSVVFNRLHSLAPSEDALQHLVKRFIKGLSSRLLALESLEITEGKQDYSRLKELYEQVINDDTPEEVNTEFVTTNLKELYGKTVQSGGIKWPVRCLDKSLGPLRRGRFGFIFARPETGKTTLVSHIATNAAAQADTSSILWFNNEQAGEEVMVRNYQSALGLTTEEVFKDLDKVERSFLAAGGEKIRIFDSANIHRRDVERIVTKLQPSLIIFDQIDKIKGFDDDRNDLELGSIYIWGRELAKGNCPVIGICQAGGSGENKRWLTMDDVVNAKTSKQAEADWILGIGKIFEPGYENIRFFNICKNKLMGDKDTDPRLRHGKLDVRLDQERARYHDTMQWE